MYAHGYGLFGWGWSWIFWVFLIIVAALIVAWALGPRRRVRYSSQTPEEILKMRYARGEIDREEYQRRLEDLRR
jgi:putative membrane protein